LLLIVVVSDAKQSTVSMTRLLRHKRIRDRAIKKGEMTRPRQDYLDEIAHIHDSAGALAKALSGYDGASTGAVCTANEEYHQVLHNNNDTPEDDTGTSTTHDIAHYGTGLCNMFKDAYPVRMKSNKVTTPMTDEQIEAARALAKQALPHLIQAVLDAEAGDRGHFSTEFNNEHYRSLRSTYLMHVNAGQGGAHCCGQKRTYPYVPRSRVNEERHAALRTLQENVNANIDNPTTAENCRGCGLEPDCDPYACIEKIQEMLKALRFEELVSDIWTLTPTEKRNAKILDLDNLTPAPSGEID